MKLSRYSIRVRLTLSYTLVLVAILAVAAACVYLVLQNRMDSMAKAELDREWDTLIDVIVNSGGDLFDVAHLGQTRVFRIEQGGVTVYETVAWKESNLDRAVELADSLQNGQWRDYAGDVWALRQGRVPQYRMSVIYAQSKTAAITLIDLLLSVLLAMLPFAAIVSLTGGYLLAGRALAPVKDITRKAREISPDRLSDRLPTGYPGDEFGQLAAVFNDTLGRIEESFERLKRFTADASHELRTPLTSIRSVGEVALRGSLDPAATRDAIGSMLEDVDRLTRLLDDLLTLAAGDAGRVRISAAAVELEEFAGEIIEEQRILAEEKSQSITLNSAGPAEAFADAATLRLAVTNVLHNAIRYTPTGGAIQISISFGSAGSVCIDVRDDGPGIPRALRERVFERFYRTDTSRSRSEGGTGLGLSIARWAVDANGGTIGFLDPEGPGAWCRIVLPRFRDGHSENRDAE